MEAKLDRNKQDLPPPLFKDCSAALGRGVNSTSVTKTKLIPEPRGNSKDRSAALNIGIHVQLLKKTVETDIFSQLIL